LASRAVSYATPNENVGQLTAVVLIFEFAQPAPAFLVPVLIAVAGSVAASECIRRVIATRDKVAVSDRPVQTKA
jgi:hypothetical protein